jgi:hypothetical protein
MRRLHFFDGFEECQHETENANMLGVEMGVFGMKLKTRTELPFEFVEGRLEVAGSQTKAPFPSIWNLRKSNLDILDIQTGRPQNF